MSHRVTASSHAKPLLFSSCSVSMMFFNVELIFVASYNFGHCNDSLLGVPWESPWWVL